MLSILYSVPMYTLPMVTLIYVILSHCSLFPLSSPVFSHDIDIHKVAPVAD